MTTIEFNLKPNGEGCGWFVRQIRVTRVTRNGQAGEPIVGTAGTTWRHGSKGVEALAGLLALYKHEALLRPPRADPVYCEEGTLAGQIARRVQGLLTDSGRPDAASRYPWVGKVFGKGGLDSLLHVYGVGPFTIELEPELSISDVSFVTDHGPLGIAELKDFLASRDRLDRPPSIGLTSSTEASTDHPIEMPRDRPRDTSPAEPMHPADNRRPETTVLSAKLVYLSAHEDRNFAWIGITFTVSPEIAREDFDAIAAAAQPKARAFTPHLSQVVADLYGLSDGNVRLSTPKYRWICDDWRSHCPYIRYDISVLTEEPDEKLGISGASGVHFEVGDAFRRDSFVLQFSPENRADLSDVEKQNLIEFGERVSPQVGELIRLTWPKGVQRVEVGTPEIVRHGDWGGEALVITAYPIDSQPENEEGRACDTASGSPGQPQAPRTYRRQEFFLLGCGLGNWLALDDVDTVSQLLETIDRVGLSDHSAVIPILELRDRLAASSSPRLPGAWKLWIKRVYDEIPQLRLAVRGKSSADEFNWFNLGRLLYLVAVTAIWHDDHSTSESTRDLTCALDSTIEGMTDLPSPVRQEIEAFINEARQNGDPCLLYEHANSIARAIYSFL